MSRRQVEIRCSHENDQGQPCGRFLGLLQGKVLRIFCPRCKAWHDIDLRQLCMALDELETEEYGGTGFML